MSATHDEEPVGKRAKTGGTESEAGSAVPEHVPEQPVSGTSDTVEVPAQPAYVPSEHGSSPVQRRRAETLSSTRYRERTYGCPCCQQTFKSTNL
eukprot:682384-Amphidinium_carterae.1